MIHVRRLRKCYDDPAGGQYVAVDEISFDVMPGEVFGLLGANGAGKTTTLRILATLLKPTSGSVHINGFDAVNEPQNVRQQLGFVSVNTATYDRMTAWEMIEFFGRLHGMPIEQVRVQGEALLRRFDMHCRGDVLGANMSTGMRQKVSLIRALVHNPPVLVLDEAASGLDVIAAREVMRTVSALRDDGKCIVLSTHNMHEVQQLCTRLAILHRGRIAAQGTPDELMQRFDCPSIEDLFFACIHQFRLVANGSELWQ